MICMWKAIFILWFLQIVSSQDATLVLLTDAVTDGAVCLDGSPSAYYFLPGTGTGANKWLLFHQGGGWCTSISDCYSRSQGNLGSSKAYPKTTNLGGGYFSRDPAVNPYMYNWNMVNFQYCDGASFSGDNATVTVYQGNNLYFRGFRNLKAYLKDLSVNHNLLMGTDFVISGCSAGGLATYLHVDWWSENLPGKSVVKGLPDSGFFLDYDSVSGPKYATDMAWVFNQQNATSGVNQDCITSHAKTKDEYKCFFAEHTAPFIKTPIFPLQSEYDSWQVQNILGSNNVEAVNTFGTLLTDRLKNSVLNNQKNGCFLDSCFHHCGNWNSIFIDKTLSSDAVEEWYLGATIGVFVQDQKYPCDSCCKPT